MRWNLMQLEASFRYEGRGQKSGEYREFMPCRVLGAPEGGARAPVA
jgi:histidyl-tRNA synthetase